MAEPARAARRAPAARAGRAACTTQRAGELAAAAVQGVDALEAYFARYLPQLVLAGARAARDPRLASCRELVAAGDPRGHRAADPALHGPDRHGAPSSARARAGGRSALLSGALPRRRARPGDAARARPRARAGARRSTRRASATAARRWRRCASRFLSALVLELLAMLGTALVAATVGVQLVGGSLGADGRADRAASSRPSCTRRCASSARSSTPAPTGWPAAERIVDVLDVPAGVAAVARRRAPRPDPRAPPSR